MPNEFYLLAVLIIVGFALVIWFLNRKLTRPEENQALTEWLKSMQTSIEGTSKTLNEAMRSTNKDITETLVQSTRNLNERLDRAGRYIAQVASEVGKMSEIGRSMKDLQEFLKSPKLRGNLGEEVLKDLISQMFPKNSFHLQYTFRSGEKVDAALRTDAGLIPIDSKFPMENFQKMVKADTEDEKNRHKRAFVFDVKKHIKNISQKYILPEENTIDFAVMYIPSEPVYYEVVNEPELLDYARKTRVYVVSPSTLYAMLHTLLLSFEGKKIEARSREIFRMIRAMKKDYEKTESQLGILGRHIGNAYNQLNKVFNHFNLLGQKLSSTSEIGNGIGVEAKELEE
jgi:DNA recombination protein RmuC